MTDEYTICAVYALAAWGGIAALASGGRMASRAFLAGAAALAAAGASAALDGEEMPAALLMIAGVALAVLAARGSSTTSASVSVAPTDALLRLARWEWMWLGAIVVGAGLARFIGLERFPDFLHGEEVAWTTSVGFYTASDERSGIIDWFSSGTPTSFWQQWPFIKLMGADYFTPRYETAFFGTLTVALFYFLARALSDARTAVFASAIMAFSVAPLASSRGAFAQSHVLFWVVLSFTAYVYALESKRTPLFVVTGVSLALGALTYQTYLTAIPVIGLHFLYCAALERRAWRAHVANAAAMTAPLLIVAPRVREYLRGQESHVTGGQDSLTRIGDSVFEAPGAYVSQSWDNLQSLLHELFIAQSVPDYIVIRQAGPVVLSGVAVLALIGLGLTMRHAHQRRQSFVLLALALPLLYSPIHLGAPFVRAIIAAYPALFLLGAIGIAAFLPDRDASPWLRRPQLSRRWGGAALSWAAPLFTTAGLAVAGTYAYFAETTATTDGQIRMEFVRRVASDAGEDTRLIIPIAPNTDDWADAERVAVRFAIASAAGFDDVDDHYAVVPYQSVLTAIQDPAYANARKIVVLHKQFAPQDPVTAADGVNQALARCYNDLPRKEWDFFVTIEAPDEDKGCRAAESIDPQAAATSSNDAPVLRWTASPGAGPLSLTVERMRDGVFVFDAEAYPLMNNWAADSRTVPGFFGSGFLLDAADSGDQTIPLDLERAAEYFVWLRTYRRADDGTQRWLSIGGSPPAEISQAGGTLNAWVWQRFGPYDLQAGTNEVLLTREGSGLALFIDEFRATTDAYDPSIDPLWTPATTLSAPDVMAGAGEYALPEPLPAGRYRWSLTALDGAVVDGLGNPLVSPFADLTVTP